MQLDFCPNCFENTSSNKCPKCGFDIFSMETSPIALKPGTVLSGKYKIGKVLGIGGFGITYMGYDIQKNVKYAIKEYMPKDIALRQPNGKIQPIDQKSINIYKNGLDMFLYETNIMVTLSGSNTIVEAYDFVLENETGYLVMEYLDGINVNKLLNSRGTIDSEFALNVLFEVARALKVVHSKGLLHRDISPENIMVLKDGSIKLIDFGAARFFVGEKSRSLSLILKHGFAPPEQYSSTANQGEWTDIYALAATYYKLVTGTTLPDALSRTTSDTVQRLDKNYPSVKPHVGKAIQKALALNYRERYQNIDQFINALRIPESQEVKQEQQYTEKPKHRGFTSWFFGEKVANPPALQPASKPASPITSPPTPEKPYVRVVKGAVTIGLWDLPGNTEISVGRDANMCSILVSGSSISRKHCSVLYESATGKFVVCDYSSNGTYTSNGERLSNKRKYHMDSGSVIMLATTEYIMEMGVR